MKKLITFALITFCFQTTLPAQNYLAQNITLNLNQMTVKTAMDALKRDYGYSFVVVAGDVDMQRVLRGNIKDEPVIVAIQYILQGQRGVVWEIDDKLIYVRNPDNRKFLVPVKRNFTLSGRVFDTESGDALPGTNIIVEQTTTGTTTDGDGRFSLNNVPADTCYLKVSFLGYETQLIRLEPSSGNSQISVRLSPESAYMDEVVITARREEKVLQKNTEEQIIKMTPEALKFLPYLGEKDIFRGFQLMPGVSASNESNSGMFVRGGTPDQNLILYDGFTVYYVEHLHGFYSAFNTNAIKDVQLYKGGFEAKYGGRLSSVTEITSKDGNKNKFTVGGEVSLLSVNLYTEIPIGDKFTSLFAFRRSYQGYMLKRIKELNGNSNEQQIVENINNSGFPGRGGFQGGGGFPGGGGFGSDTEQTPPSYFYDLNGKMTFTPTKKDIISLAIFNGHDYTDNTPQFSYGGSGGRPNMGGGMQLPEGWEGSNPWGGSDGRQSFSGGQLAMDNLDYEKYGNFGTSLRWERTITDRLSANLLVSYSNFYATRDQRRTMAIQRSEETETVNTGTLENNNLYDYSLKNDWKYTFNDRHTFEFGAFATKYDIEYIYTQNDEDTLMNKRNDAWLTGVYFQDRIQFADNRLKVTPGLRINYFNATQKPYFEPRLGASYKLTDKISANAATGVFYQFANRISREDIMAGNTDFWILSDGASIPVSRSLHFNLGVNYDLPDFIFSVEGYYKRNHDVSEYTLRYSRERAIRNMMPGRGFRPGEGGEREPGELPVPGSPGGATQVSEEFYTGDGYATGIELLAQKKAGTFRGWVSYTAGQVKTRYPEQSPEYYFANHDVTHEVKIVGIYMFGHFDLSATWICSTGRPYTAPLGIYQITSLGDVTETYYAISDKNAFRLPAYHRLDIGLNFRFNLFNSKGRPNAISFSLFNAYNRQNVNAKQFQIVDDYILESNINYLSIMPNFSLAFKF